MSSWMKVHSQGEEWRTPRHYQSKTRQHRQFDCDGGPMSVRFCFGCKSDTNTPGWSPLINPEKPGGAKEMSLWMKVHFQSVKVTYAKAPPIKAAPASPIRLSPRYNVCKFLFWLPIIIQTNRVAPKKYPVNESSFTKWKCDVRQGTTDRGSACIANFVAEEVQHRQCVVFAANHTNNSLIMPHTQSEKFGWRAQTTYNMYKLKKRTFWVARLHVRQGITDRGSASITNSVVVEPQRLQRLVLAASQTQTYLDNGPLSIRKIRWRQRMIESSFKRWKWRTSGHHRTTQRQHHQLGFDGGSIPSTSCFGCISYTNTTW